MTRSEGERARFVAFIAVVGALGVVAAGCLGPAPAPGRLTLATTTSVNDSGLLAAILPDFEARSHAKVAVVAVGSGQALEIAKRGDADVALVHSPALEVAFMGEGSGSVRTSFMFNFFAIVGPDTDPAGVRGAPNASVAFSRIATNGSVFVSRGDNSGTNNKELALWASAGLNVTTFGPWYKSIGQGMAATLRTAYELDGYTLTDEGTYWSLPDIGPNATAKPGLHQLLGGSATNSSDLRNTYSVIQLNATRLPSINSVLARQFAEWITSNETASLIARYSVQGHQLFTPLALAVQGPPIPSPPSEPSVASIAGLTLLVSGAGTLLAALVGVPTGTLLGSREFRWRRALRAFLQSLYGLPPVLLGLLLYLALSKAGPFGGIGWLFTVPGMVLAQFLLVLPFVIGLTWSAVAAVDPSVRDTARTLGADGMQFLLTLGREARAGILAAVMVGFGRAISEVGAVIMVGGNIKGETEVLTTSIVKYTGQGDFALAVGLGLILLAVSVMVFAGLTLVQDKEEKK
jgi:tungstate transport system substrate-binding protein